MSPLWRLVRETTGKTIEAWKILDAKDIIPAADREATAKHIHQVAASIQ